MACHCSGCSRSKRISTIRQLQKEEVCTKRPSSKYPTKSKKIVWDRYLSTRKWLLKQIEWYQESYERRKTHPPKPNARYVDWFHEPIRHNTWGVKKYKAARAEAKRMGLL